MLAEAMHEHGDYTDEAIELDSAIRDFKASNIQVYHTDALDDAIDDISRLRLGMDKTILRYIDSVKEVSNKHNTRKRLFYVEGSCLAEWDKKSRLLHLRNIPTDKHHGILDLLSPKVPSCVEKIAPHAPLE